MPTTSSGTFTTNGDGTGTWALNNGDSGTFSLLDYTLNNDGSIAYRQRFTRSNGTAYGDVQGVISGDQASNSGKYAGTWTLTENNGTYTFNNYKNGILISTGSFQPLDLSSSGIPSIFQAGSNSKPKSESAQQTAFTPSAATVNSSKELPSITGPAGVTPNLPGNPTQPIPTTPSTTKATSSSALPSIAAASGVTTTQPIQRPQPSGSIPSTAGVSASRALPNTNTPSGINPKPPSNRPQQMPANPITLGSSATRTQPIVTAPSGGIPNSASNRPQPTTSTPTKTGTFATKASSSNAAPVKASTAATANRTQPTPSGSETNPSRVVPFATPPTEVNPAASINRTQQTQQKSTPTDPITGQRLRLGDIGLVTSDTLYSGVSNITKGLRDVFLPDYTDADLASLNYIAGEFEYNNNFLVVTLAGKGDNRPYTNTDTSNKNKFIARGTGDWVARGVVEGSFMFEADGSIGASTIRSVASSIVQVSQNGRLGQISRSSNPAGLNIPKLSKLGDIETLSNPNQLAAAAFFTQNILTPSGERDNYATDPTASQQVAQFGGGRFFYAGWETNPFSSNLI